MINNEVNMQTTLTIPSELKIKLEILAKEDNQSIDNLIVNILDKYTEHEFSDIDK